ncbi:MAG: hypothetical protein EBE86_019535 [Hormoscilla sp. GUM202]|nr:hypothetical protein [Hormoscilla sp. GUM202]
MEAIELKFMLKLLEFTGYRAPISKIKPNQSTKAPERDTACSVNKCNAFVIDWGYTQFRPDSLMSRYSLDFRRKVVTAYELGFGSIRQLADQFMISPATVHSYIKRSR